MSPSKVRSHVRVLALLFAASAATCFSARTFQIDPPGGTISGAPGDTVGWGFTLTNTEDFIVVTGSDFCEGPFATPCPHVLGTYSDFIGPNFVVVGPLPESTSVAQSFDATLLLGLGSFTIDPGAQAGDFATGTIYITYDLYSVSPNDLLFDPFTDTISRGNLFSADAVVTAVPEPSSGFLLAAALGWVVLRGNRARSQRLSWRNLPGLS